MTNSPLDPSYWEALGVTGITINVEDSQSVDDALQQITQIITDAANESDNKPLEESNG